MRGKKTLKTTERKAKAERYTATRPASDMACVHMWFGLKYKSETSVTASVIKQDPNTYKVQKNAYVLGHKHTVCKFSG